MQKKNNRQNKDIARILILVGAIIALVLSLLRLISVTIYRIDVAVQLPSLVQAGISSNIVSLIISIIISVAILFYSRVSSKNDFVVILILSIIGLIFSMGVGGVLILIGAILGIINSR